MPSHRNNVRCPTLMCLSLLIRSILWILMKFDIPCSRLPSTKTETLIIQYDIICGIELCSFRGKTPIYLPQNLI